MRKITIIPFLHQKLLSTLKIYVVNFDKIKKKLGIKKFVSVEMGIIEMIKYLKKQRSIKKFFKFGNYKIRN